MIHTSGSRVPFGVVVRSSIETKFRIAPTRACGRNQVHLDPEFRESGLKETDESSRVTLDGDLTPIPYQYLIAH